MKRTVLAVAVFFLFAAMAWAKDDEEHGDGNHKHAVVGVWTMGFCQAAPFNLPFGCTTQLMNFHEDGSVWSSFMFDQDPARFGGLSVGAAGKWHYLGDHRFFVTMLRFANSPSSSTVTPPGNVATILRTDLIVEAHPKSDEAVTTKMVFMYFNSESVPSLPYWVVKKDPYQDEPNQTSPGPSGVPMKRIPSLVPDSPVLLP
jgi:hypothetical protein